jgi:AcrR family transcriptional regulator
VGGERVTNLESLLPPKRGRNGEATRARILDAAEGEFAVKGFDGARLAAIARAADVPQALIHHHFADKDGLYRAVLERALTSVADMGWRILGEMAPPKRPTRAARMEKAQLQALIEAMIGMLVGFYATHANVLRILRHEATRGGSLADELVRAHVKPQLDDVVARFGQMRKRGEVRADVDARHLCISAVAMACFPYMEGAFLEAVWTVDPRSPAFVAERTREIVQTVMARIAPAP